MTRRYLYPGSAPDALERMLAFGVEGMRRFDPRFSNYRADATAIGHEIDGALAGVVIFDTFGDGDCLWHVASDGSRRWITREFIIRSMAFPFIQLNQRRLSALVSERNAPSLSITRAFGMTEEGRMREAGPHGEDMLLFGLLRRECRWLPMLPTAMAA